MNYSQYFHNKVDAHLSDSYNVFVVSVDSLGNNTILANFTTPYYSEVEALITKLDPFNVFFKDKEITLKVYDVRETEKV
jgi:hypothetical protein